jgi:hypothetical protein
MCQPSGLCARWMPGPVVTTTGRGCVSPPGLMNANLCGSIVCIALVARCGRYSQAALHAVGPLNPPAPYSPGQSPGGEGGPSSWMERT